MDPPPPAPVSAWAEAVTDPGRGRGRLRSPAPGEIKSMGDTTIGLLHPGEMGAAVGQCLAGAGHRVLWAPEGRSAATAARAAAAGLVACGLAEMIRRSDLIMSVSPPHAALDIARQVAGFGGVYLDANAISPATAREVAGIVEAGGASYVDGGIIGTPPVAPGFIRLYLSGPRAGELRDLFDGSPVDARLVDHGAGSAVGASSVGGAGVAGVVGAASAVKMAYASWTKGIGRPAAGGAGTGPGRGRGGDAAGRVGHLPAGPGANGRPARPDPRRPRAGAGSRRWRRSPRPWPRPACPRVFTRPRPRFTADSHRPSAPGRRLE